MNGENPKVPNEEQDPQSGGDTTPEAEKPSAENPGNATAPETTSPAKQPTDDASPETPPEQPKDPEPEINKPELKDGSTAFKGNAGPEKQE